MIDWDTLTDYIKGILPFDFLPDDFHLRSMTDVDDLLDELENYDGIDNEEVRPMIPVIKRKLTEMSVPCMNITDREPDFEADDELNEIINRRMI